ncbi:MAG: tRNA pseudouridine(55) synthase TruB [Burkholderiaceae bacterium]
MTVTDETARSRPSGRAARERIDGVLLFDKPQGLSSNQAMMAARRLMGAAKAGHGGTLDPMATGLLPLLFGEATKFAHDLLDADKTYLAEMTLGTRTDTGDREGEVIATAPCASTPDEVRRAAAGFVGDIDQVPPMYSALKRDGKPLYAYAREGVTLERAARRVTIHAIDLVDVDLPRVSLRVHCSKGTYIRTLVEDIGLALGCGAHLSALRREAVAGLAVADAVTLTRIEALDLVARRALLGPLDSLLAGLPDVRLDPAMARRFGLGQRLRLHPPDGARSRVRVYANERLLGLAALDDGVLVPQRLISTETPP